MHPECTIYEIRLGNLPAPNILMFLMNNNENYNKYMISVSSHKYYKYLNYVYF